MKTTTNLRDFSNYNLYIGIDSHLKSWKVTLYSDEFELKTFSQDPIPEKLARYLKRNYPKANYQCVYEAGFSGYWAQRKLQKLGIPCIISHPADIPTTDKERKQKNDKRDSRKLSRSLKNNELNSIYIPTEQLQHDRSLVRLREALVKDQTRAKNRVKSFLYFNGITPTGSSKRRWSNKFIEGLKQIDLGNDTAYQVLHTYIVELEDLKKQVSIIDKRIRELSKTMRYSKNVSLLLSVPSIGVLTAMIILTEIGDIRRFKTLDQLCSYVGLIPNTHSSGEKEKVGRNTKRGNHYIKSKIIECAWTAVRKDPALLLSYKRLCGRMKENEAIIRIAKKLLNRIRYILINQEEYVTGLTN